MARRAWRVARKYGYRSGLEISVKNQLKENKIKFEYEPKDKKVKFVEPEKNRTYTPDFVLRNGIIIETKGRFMPHDRKKFQWIRQQHPDLDIRFVFNNPNTKLRKGSKTTYATWCDKHGFKYAKKEIPSEWLSEF